MEFITDLHNAQEAIRDCAKRLRSLEYACDAIGLEKMAEQLRDIATEISCANARVHDAIRKEQQEMLSASKQEIGGILCAMLGKETP